tara:strand:+ start:784 stop:1899 length:1116 start_codon:yes stop_codon:yes gene_type:complete
MEKPEYITGYTNTDSKEIDKKKDLEVMNNPYFTKPLGDLLWCSLEETGWIDFIKNGSFPKDGSFPIRKYMIKVTCKYIDYENLKKNKNGIFKDHVLMMKNTEELNDFMKTFPDYSYTSTIYSGRKLINYTKLKNEFGGIGCRDYIESWSIASFAIWNYDCIVDDEQDKGKQNQQQQNRKQQPLNEVQENLRGDKGQGNLHTILQGQQQNQQPQNQEQKNSKQMRNITDKIKNLNTQIQEAINKTQDSQIKNSITEKTGLIGENVDSLISILTRIQNKYISQSEIIQLSQSENIQLSQILKEDYNKLQLAKKLYPKIHKIEPKLSVTVMLEITRMILELDNDDILEIINNHDLLKEKIKEGKQVLTEYNFAF